MKKPYTTLCPHCGLKIELHEKFPLRFYVNEGVCPHCHSTIQIKSNQICNLMNLIIALLFLLVFEEKLICLGILFFVYFYILCSHKLKQKLIHFGYFKANKMN